MLKNDVRFFYYNDSEPGDALKTAKPGSTSRLLGMPRLNLDAVLTSSEGKSSVVMPVPFEFVIVAKLKEE